MKLRSRLYVLVVVTIVPMIILAGVAGFQVQKTMRDAALQGITETANATALIVDREIAGALASVRVLANSPMINDADWARFHALAVNVTSATQGWVILYDADGRQVVNTRLPFGDTLGNRSVSITVSDILKQDSPQVSGLVWSPVLHRNLILVDFPIRTPLGKRYVLSQAFFADHFDIAVMNRGVPKTWIVGIFDRQGITISRSVRGSEFVGKPARPATFAAMKTGAPVTLKHVIRGDVEVYDVITRSALSGWGVAVGVPAGEIDGNLRRVGWLALLGLALAIVVSLAVAAYTGGKFARAIRSAAHASSAIGRGEPVGLPAATGIRELDSLQQAIYGAGRALSAAEKGREQAEKQNARLLRSEQQARIRADAENKRKDEFLAMLGHELRNPLSAIMSASTLLNMKEASVAISQKAAGIIQRQSDHLRSILDDLLDLSRVLHGKVKLEPATIDFGALVTAQVDDLVATGKLDDFVFTFESTPVGIIGDRTRIQQIFANVMDNALKYTPSGGAISVRVKQEKDDAVLVVADNGIGIAPEILPYIFDTFVQGNQSLARTKGGMGVGLSLAKKLVELHNGTIRVRSDGAGKGATFIVRLPATPSQPPAPEPKARTARSAAGYRILLVEDQDDGREMMKLLLTSLGHRVTTASDAEQALKAAAETHHDLVLSDIGLPGMDGYALAARLRADPATSKLKLVALTGYGLDTDKEKARQAGFDFHLTKPLRVADLQVCLDTLMG